MTFLIPVLLVGDDGGGATTAGPQAPGRSSRVRRRPTEKPPRSRRTAEPVPELPVSLARIQRALSRPPAIRLKGERLVFRVEVLGRKPSIEDILGPDYLKGPVPYGGDDASGVSEHGDAEGRAGLRRVQQP